MPHGRVRRLGLRSGTRRAAGLTRSRRTSLAQGAFYLVTGLWPIASMRSFEAVTGPRSERWLVQTTGALIAAIGAALIGAARDRGAHRSREQLAALSVLALGGADLYFVARRRIPAIYLADAVIEAGFAAAALHAVLGTPRR